LTVRKNIVRPRNQALRYPAATAPRLHERALTDQSRGMGPGLRRGDKSVYPFPPARERRLSFGIGVNRTLLPSGSRVAT